jgi:hypothetical protein
LKDIPTSGKNKILSLNLQWDNRVFYLEQVDIFMDATFDTVRRDIGLLQIKLRGLNSKLMNNRVSATVAESMAEVIGQQCEASIQVLQSLCQPDAFRDKVLNHKVSTNYHLIVFHSRFCNKSCIFF